MILETKPYLPADGILVSGDRTKAEQANFNQTAGPADSIFLNGELIGCGGVRLSVGEAWFCLTEDMRQRLAEENYAPEKKALIKLLRDKIEEYSRNERLYRLYAEARLSERFIKALGFEKRNNLFVR